MGTTSWLSTSFGGSRKRRPATWLRRRAVGHAEEDEGSVLLFFLSPSYRIGTVILDRLWSRAGLDRWAVAVRLAR
jgi:hypothetical protein